MSWRQSSGACLLNGFSYWLRFGSYVQRSLYRAGESKQRENVDAVIQRHCYLNDSCTPLRDRCPPNCASDRRKEKMAAAPGDLPELSISTNQQFSSHGVKSSLSSQSLSRSSCPETPRPSPEGVECHGDERQTLLQMGRFYDNPHLSDISIRVGGHTFCAHKIILIRASDVFERMFSSDWDDKSQEVELVEDAECEMVFPAFMRFLYTCQISLTITNTLPILVLADKYNIEDLQKVCINFACVYVIPRLQLKDVFHVWFQYSTKSYHQILIQAAVCTLAQKMEDMMSSEEWEIEWLGLDLDQLREILRNSELVVQDEFTIWTALLKWLNSQTHPARLENMETNLCELVPFIRFPMMSPDQLCEIERSKLAETYRDVLMPPITQAFKYNSLSLNSRSSMPEFTTSQYLLRCYNELRWDRRLIIPHYSTLTPTSEMLLKFQTRSSSFPVQAWDWELKIFPRGFTAAPDDFRCLLYSNILMEQSRAVEYSLSIVDENRIICTVTGKKHFSKSRYTADTEIDKKISVSDLIMDFSPYLVRDNLILQIHLKPLE